LAFAASITTRIKLAEEFGALQLDWKKRGLMTDEAIQSLRSLWRENLSSFNGKYFNFTGVRSYPKPVQANGVPILVGGHSRAAVRRAAKFGDGFFPAVGELKELSWEIDAAAFVRLRDLLKSRKPNPRRSAATILKWRYRLSVPPTSTPSSGCEMRASRA
jgi:alkanesulfonate monooxygenase SsuD/methylene tetrahydromethanopterin reductase-like flavin-dependent oxidoreductase (luciferase family)